MMKPPLFRNDHPLKIRVLSWLLWQANSDPRWCKQAFYRLKDGILKQYAKPDGHDWQEIVRYCNSCEGTGGLYEPGGCRKCWGDGIYSRTYVQLHRWRLGNRVFHCPGEGSSRLPEGETVQIKGYVRHSQVKHAYLATWILALLFDWEYARVLFSWLRPVMFLKRQWRRITPRFERCRECRQFFFRGPETGNFCSDECHRNYWNAQEVPF